MPNAPLAPQRATSRTATKWRRDLIAIVVTGVAYYAGARVGLLPALVRGQVTPFWPPTGIAVVCMLVFGLRTYPGVAIASFAVNAPLGPTLPAALGIAVGNTLAPIAAVLALRALKVSVDLARLRDSFLFVVVAVSSMTISATSGTAILRLSGGVDAGQGWSTWWVWWAGDAMGVLVVAPVLLQLPRMRHWRLVSPMNVVEGVVLLGLVGVVMRYVISIGSPVAVLICPLLVWAAVRLRQLGAALVALEVAVIASAAAAGHHGTFGHGDLVHAMLRLQLFNASIALTGLLLAAVIAQLDDSRRDIAIANLLLSHRVEQSGAELELDRSRIAVLADRHRIATQLHDTVLQRLFGIGAALEGAAATSNDGRRQTLARLVDELDATIEDLAVAIYQVEEDNPDAPFRDAIDHVIAASTKPSGLEPTLALTGDGERVPLALRPQVLAALHEGLTDVAASPEARGLSVAVVIERHEIGISITAEHTRAAPAIPREGIRRADARARRLGGTCTWQTIGAISTVELRFPTG